EQVATIRDWIDQGLAWDESLLPTTPAQSDHSMFQPVVRPKLPATQWVAPRSAARSEIGAKAHDTSASPIDAFIAAKHEELKLAPAAAADRRTLLRRVTLDLTGLPPTPQELADFLNDESPEAYRKVLD